MKKFGNTGNLMIFPLLIVLAIGVAFAAENDSRDVYVNVPIENLRSSPDGKKIGNLFYGSRLRELERKGKWVRVRTEGWIFEQSVSDGEPAQPPKEKSALEIESWKWANEKGPHRIRIEGVIRNNSADILSDVRMSITAKDADGNFLGTANVVVQPGTIPPGISSIFTAYIKDAVCVTSTIDITYRFDVR
ncbi:MAG: SH3 domain-containing protein [Nitrospiraceae bacterium]|nr:MAG: SH3 domain-containing protein [Nitrospiraceae bacterium]